MLASMLSIVYYRLQNAILFLWENIRSWCDICVCLQRENELGVTQELVLQSKGLVQVRYFWCIICDLSRNISVVPNPQFPFNTELLTTSTFRDPLDSSSLSRLYFSRPTWQFFPWPYLQALHLSNGTSLRLWIPLRFWQWWGTVKLRLHPLPWR